MIRTLNQTLSAGLILLCLATPGATQQVAQETTQQTIDLSTLTTQANAGDSAAQLQLAILYHSGQGVAQNFATAADWALSAAKAGEPAAQNLLGRYYHTGLGVQADQAEAIHWLQAAAQSGEPQYVYDLGFALENSLDGANNDIAAASAYAQAADAGLAEAIVSLGVLYQEGRGVPQDFNIARQLYEQAAQAGHPRAQNNLGLLYVRGNGVLQDYEAAAALFAQAAEQGLQGALRNLGVMYENGFGVPVDEARATELYRLAGGQAEATEAAPMMTYDTRLTPPPEDETGLKMLEQMAIAGDPVAQFQAAWLMINTPDAPPIMLYQAAQLFGAAAQAGHGPSMRNLGVLYFEGRGVPQDYVLGRMWLTLAGSSGQMDARALIEQLSQTMTAAQINEAQMRVETWTQRNL